MAFAILVDYDNLEIQDRNKGLIYVAEKIIKTFDLNDVGGNKNILLRLYGGWYENTSITNRAQKIAVQTSSDFPRTVLLSDNKTKIIANVEIAYSLIALPQFHLFSTFRIRGYPVGLSSIHPNNSLCSDSSCPMINVFEFIKNNECGKCRRVTPEQMIFRSEQKLVDTMLTSDLIYLASTHVNTCIVSSDDDFWPGILTALNIGIKVIQIHTKQRKTNTHYLKTATINYSQKSL